MTPPESQALMAALVAAYPSHVRSRAAPVAGLDEAIATGQRWLEDRLGELLALPFERQRRGPLELFQEAMRFPTAALVDAGVDPAQRDPAAQQALPGDLYDLAPASTRDLGEETWTLHLAWGAAKAAAVTRQAPAPPDAGDG